MVSDVQNVRRGPFPSRVNAMSDEILVYSQPMCAGCEQAKGYLKQKGIPFTVKDVYNDPAAREELRALNMMSTPVIKIGATIIGGFNPKKIDRALAERATPLAGA